MRIEFKKEKYDSALEQINVTLSLIDTYRDNINSKKVEVDRVSDDNHIYLFPIDDEMRRVELLLNSWEEHLNMTKTTLNNVYNIWLEYCGLSDAEKESKSDYYNNVIKTISHFSFESPDKFMETYENFKNEGSGDFFDYVISGAGVTSKIVYMDEYISTQRLHMDTVVDAAGNPVVSDDYIASDWAGYLANQKDGILNGFLPTDNPEADADGHGSSQSAPSAPVDPVAESTPGQSSNVENESDSETSEEMNNNPQDWNESLVSNNTEHAPIRHGITILPTSNNRVSGIQNSAAVLIGRESNNNNISSTTNVYISKLGTDDGTSGSNDSSSNDN